MTEEEHDAKLAEEAQALREEVAALRITRDDFKLERDLARKNFCDEQAANYQLQAHLKACLGELSELRARVVVVPERELFTQYLPGAIPRNADEVSAWKEGWNACLDELARLNGKVVSEADIFASVQAVRDRYPVVVFPSDGASVDCKSAAMARVVCDAVMKELSTLLNQDKENGNG